MPRRSIAELSAEVAGQPDSTAVVELAAAYRERGDLERALRLCLRGLEYHPTLVAAHFELGLIYEARGERERALEQWAVVRRVAPEYVPARCALARAYASAGRRADAVREVEDALRLRPGDGEAQSLLAELTGSAGGGPPRGGVGAVGAAGAAGAAEAPVRRSAFDGLAEPQEWMGAVAVDEGSNIILGVVLADGREVTGEVAERWAGARQEAGGVASYLGLGEWRGLVVESDGAQLILEPLGRGLLIVATTPDTPAGRTRRIREAVRERAMSLLPEKG